MQNPNVFEGPEKTLRVFFKTTNLLLIPDSKWSEILEKAQCKILNTKKTSAVHTYLLSESSLFVYPTQILLKTCGTTELLNALPILLDTVNTVCSNNEIQLLFYTRRPYFFPNEQLNIHKSWQTEINYLEKFFPENTHTQTTKNWHLFVYDHNSSKFLYEQCQWMEMMMSELSLTSSKKFWYPFSTKGAEITRKTKIPDLFKEYNQLIDSFAFDPCGYSCNGVLSNTNEYYTIHVTPQTTCSYTSFETNAVLPTISTTQLSYTSLCNRVLTIFEPEEVQFVLCLPVLHLNILECVQFKGYKITHQESYFLRNLVIIQITLCRSA